MSREKQIEELAEILQKVCDATPNGKCISKLCCACRAETVIEAGYRKQSGWISVEERIPKNFESVLVLATRPEDDEYDVLVAYHDRGDWEEQHTRRYESPICGEIKYWMPLPEPLKAKQPKDLENFEKKRLLPGDCFHGEVWCRCPYCLTSIEAHSIPKDRICHNCGKEYL